MFATSYRSEGAEYASDRALELLDELRIRVMECRLVLHALPDEADLKFDELEQDLYQVQHGAHLAYQAASMMHQGADLNPRWGVGFSRPKAIFARHNAAVYEGANRVTPELSLWDRLERALSHVPSVKVASDPIGTPPRCTGTVRATGLPCTAAATRIEGVVGAHCYSHATAHERDKYRKHRDAITAAHDESQEKLLCRRRTVAEDIAERWLSNRANRQQWVDSIDSADNSWG